MYDGAGNVVAANVSLLQIGNTYYVDTSNNTLKQITEPFSAFIGGISGQFTVGGATFLTGLQGQDYLTNPEGASPNLSIVLPTDAIHCKTYPAPTECIWGRSWNNHSSPFIAMAGIQVMQAVGGYQESTDPCFGIPPWCTTHSGSNQLTLEGWLFGDPLNPAKNVYFQPRTVSNVTNITWAVNVDMLHFRVCGKTAGGRLDGSLQ